MNYYYMAKDEFDSKIYPDSYLEKEKKDKNLMEKEFINEAMKKTEH
jgi:hypothetical protein